MATIFEKVFQPRKFPKTEYFPTNRIISHSSRTCKLFTDQILYPDWSTCPYFFLPPKVRSANWAFRPIRAQYMSVKK